MAKTVKRLTAVQIRDLQNDNATMRLSLDKLGKECDGFKSLALRRLDENQLLRRDLGEASRLLGVAAEALTLRNAANTAQTMKLASEKFNPPMAKSTDADQLGRAHSGL